MYAATAAAQRAAAAAALFAQVAGVTLTCLPHKKIRLTGCAAARTSQLLRTLFPGPIGHSYLFIYSTFTDLIFVTFYVFYVFFGRWKASLIATTVVLVVVVTVFEKCLRLC